MADRRLAAAAACFIVALVIAGGALVALATRQPPAPAAAVVAVPPPPPVAPGEDASARPSAPTTAEATPAEATPAEATPAEATPAEATPAEATAGTGGEPPEPAEATTAEAAAAVAETRPTDAAEPAARTAPPERLIVIATGIAWNDDLAAAAALRLPPAVAFALPADLPTAVERLARWRAAGREVALRFDWVAAAASADVAVPLGAGPAAQAGRMEQQWAALDGAAAAVVVEPHAAEALASIARSVAADRRAPVLLGTTTPAPPPRAWRLDADRLGERQLEDALTRVVDGVATGGTLVLLLEIYPALLDRFVDWLGGLADHGVALVPLDVLAGDRS